MDINFVKQNVLFVGLSDQYARSVAECIADKLGLYFLDLDQLIDYSIIDKYNVKKVCGIKYLEDEEKRVITSVNDYERTVISVKYGTFVKYNNIFSEKTLVVYLKLNHKTLNKLNEKESINVGINDIIFEERNKYLKKNCDIVFNCDILNLESDLDKLLNEIKGKLSEN